MDMSAVDREEARRSYIQLIGDKTAIVSNASENVAPHEVAYDIVNFIPDKVGQLRKIPIGFYRRQFPDNIAKIISFHEKQASRLLVSLDNGALYTLLNQTATQLTFPSQTPLVHSATDEPTVIEDYFVYRNKLFLATGTHVNYVYNGSSLTLWGQDGAIEPVDVSDIVSYAYVSPTAILAGTVTIPSTDNGFCYEVTTAGTTSGTEPDWPTTVGGTVLDGMVTWTCKSAVTLSDAMTTHVNYIVTWWDGQCESNPSSPCANTVQPTNALAAVTLSTGGANVEQIRVYRYESETKTYRLVKGLDKGTYGISDDSTYVFVDVISENSLGDEVEYDNDLPPRVSNVAVFANRAWGAGDKHNPNRLYYSKLENPYAWPNYIEVEDRSGDEIIGLVPLKTELLIFKKFSTHVLTGFSEDTFSVKELFPAGAYSKSSIVTANDSVFFLSRDGFYVTDGMSVRKISSEIEDHFRRENIWTMQYTTSLYVPQFNGIYWNISKPFDSAGGVTWIYLPDRHQWFRTTMGITDGVVMDGEAYLALTDTVYQMVDTGYPTVQSVYETHDLPLSTSTDKAIVRHVSVTGGGMEIGTLIYLYYKADFSESWSLLGSVTITAEQETHRVSCNIHCNYLKLKLEHTGGLKRLVQITLETMYKRLEPHE